MSTNLNNLIITNQNYANPLHSNKSNLGSTKNSKNNNNNNQDTNKINFNESYNSLNKDFPGFSIPSDNENIHTDETKYKENYENLNENEEDASKIIFNERRKISTNSKNKQTYRGSKGKFDFENLSIQNTSKEILRTEGSYERKFTDNLLNKINFKEDSCEELEQKMESVFQKCNKGNKLSYSKGNSLNQIAEDQNNRTYDKSKFNKLNRIKTIYPNYSNNTVLTNNSNTSPNNFNNNSTMNLDVNTFNKNNKLKNNVNNHPRISNVNNNIVNCNKKFLTQKSVKTITLNNIPSKENINKQTLIETKDETYNFHTTNSYNISPNNLLISTKNKINFSTNNTNYSELSNFNNLQTSNNLKDKISLTQENEKNQIKESNLITVNYSNTNPDECQEKNLNLKKKSKSKEKSSLKNSSLNKIMMNTKHLKDNNDNNNNQNKKKISGNLITNNAKKNNVVLSMDFNSKKNKNEIKNFKESQEIYKSTNFENSNNRNKDINLNLNNFEEDFKNKNFGQVKNSQNLRNKNALKLFNEKENFNLKESKDFAKNFIIDSQKDKFTPKEKTNFELINEYMNNNPDSARRKNSKNELKYFKELNEEENEFNKEKENTKNTKNLKIQENNNTNKNINNILTKSTNFSTKNSLLKNNFTNQVDKLKIKVNYKSKSKNKNLKKKQKNTNSDNSKNFNKKEFYRFFNSDDVQEKLKNSDPNYNIRSDSFFLKNQSQKISQSKNIQIDLYNFKEEDLAEAEKALDLDFNSNLKNKEKTVIIDDIEINEESYRKENKNYFSENISEGNKNKNNKNKIKCEIDLEKRETFKKKLNLEKDVFKSSIVDSLMNFKGFFKNDKNILDNLNKNTESKQELNALNSKLEKLELNSAKNNKEIYSENAFNDNIKYENKLNANNEIENNTNYIYSNITKEKNAIKSSKNIHNKNISRNFCYKNTNNNDKFSNNNDNNFYNREKQIIFNEINLNSEARMKRYEILLDFINFNMKEIEQMVSKPQEKNKENPYLMKGEDFDKNKNGNFYNSNYKNDENSSNKVSSLHSKINLHSRLSYNENGFEDSENNLINNDKEKFNFFQQKDSTLFSNVQQNLNNKFNNINDLENGNFIKNINSNNSSLMISNIYSDKNQDFVDDSLHNMNLFNNNSISKNNPQNKIEFERINSLSKFDSNININIDDYSSNIQSQIFNNIILMNNNHNKNKIEINRDNYSVNTNIISANKLNNFINNENINSPQMENIEEINDLKLKNNLDKNILTLINNNKNNKNPANLQGEIFTIENKNLKSEQLFQPKENYEKIKQRKNADFINLKEYENKYNININTNTNNLEKKFSDSTELNFEKETSINKLKNIENNKNNIGSLNYKINERNFPNKKEENFNVKNANNNRPYNSQQITKFNQGDIKSLNFPEENTPKKSISTYNNEQK